MFTNLPIEIKQNEKVRNFLHYAENAMENKSFTIDEIRQNWVNTSLTSNDRELMNQYLISKANTLKANHILQKKIIIQLISLQHEVALVPFYLDLFHDQEPLEIRSLAIKILSSYSLDKLLIPISQIIIDSFPDYQRQSDKKMIYSEIKPYRYAINDLNDQLSRIQDDLKEFIQNLGDFQDEEGSFEEFTYLDQFHQHDPTDFTDGLLGEEALEFEENIFDYQGFELGLEKTTLGEIPSRYEWILHIFAQSGINIHDVRKISQVMPTTLIEQFLASKSTTYRKLILCWNILALPALQNIAKKETSDDNRRIIDNLILEIIQKNKIQLKSKFDLLL